MLSILCPISLQTISDSLLNMQKDGLAGNGTISRLHPIPQSSTLSSTTTSTTLLHTFKDNLNLDSLMPTCTRSSLAILEKTLLHSCRVSWNRIPSTIGPS